MRSWDRGVKITSGEPSLFLDVARKKEECVIDCTWSGRKRERGVKRKRGGAGAHDIKGNFPPCLHDSKLLHLVLAHKAGLVCPNTAQEARADVGTSLMVD